MERRRGARIPAKFWAQVKGVDAKPTLRRGDLSISGVYIETDQAIGEVGSVQSILLMSQGQEIRVDVLARVVRVARVEDLWKGAAVVGVALEFLLDSTDKADAVTRLLRCAMASDTHVSDSLKIDLRLDAAAQPRVDATVVGLGVRGMILDAGWPAEVGEVICCELQTPKGSRRASLSGQVVRSSPMGDRYRVEVAFPTEVTDRPCTISGAVDSVLDEVLFDGADQAGDRPKDHLRGTLDRISLASLLGFFELERMTGELALDRNGETAVVFLRAGRVVDVDGAGPARNARARLAELVDWSSGQFEFTIMPVERQDRIATSTSALLIDFARRRDEAG
jgi:hypothetical protein